MKGMNRMWRIVLFCIGFLLFGCEPPAEYWILQGTVCDQKTHAGIDSVNVFLSASQLFGYSDVLTDPIGLFEHHRGSYSLEDFEGLRKLDFNWKFSKEGYLSLDTMIPGDAFRYGTEGNYVDTLYLDSIFLQATP